MAWGSSTRGRALALQAKGYRFEAGELHMNEELYNWLEKTFMFSTIPKYRKYFKEWVDNITEDQVIGFTRMKNANYKIKQE